MTIIVKAKALHTSGNVLYPGWSVQPNQEIELTRVDVLNWRNSTAVIDAIYNDLLQIGNDTEYLTSHADQLQYLFYDEIEQTEISAQPAFANKYTSDGLKMYRRKHGFSVTVSANSNNEEQFNVPYAVCKINKIEVVGAETGDKADLKIYDTPTGSISTVPNYMLNQFGYGVFLGRDFYEDKSEYDAELIGDMKIGVTVYNNTAQEKTYYVNVVLHEVVEE